MKPRIYVLSAVLLASLFIGCKKEETFIQLDSTFFLKETEIEFLQGLNENVFLHVPYTGDTYFNDALKYQYHTTVYEDAKLLAALDGESIDADIYKIGTNMQLRLGSPKDETRLLEPGEHKLCLSCEGEWSVGGRRFNISGLNLLNFKVVPRIRFSSIYCTLPMSVGGLYSFDIRVYPAYEDIQLSVDNSDIIEIYDQPMISDASDFRDADGNIVPGNYIAVDIRGKAAGTAKVLIKLNGEVYKDYVITVQ